MQEKHLEENRPEEKHQGEKRIPIIPLEEKHLDILRKVKKNQFTRHAEHGTDKKNIFSTWHF